MGRRNRDTSAELAAVMELTSAGQDHLALPRLDALCRDHPDGADLHWARARCLFFLNRQIEGLAAVDRALALDPGIAVGGQQLVMEIYTSGRSGSALLLFQRLGGGRIEAAQRWALRARYAPMVAFGAVAAVLFPLSGALAVMPAFAAWILTFELLCLLARRRLRHLDDVDRFLLGEVIESAARSPMFTIERRDALALSAVGAGAVALGLIPSARGADVPLRLVIGASAVGALLIVAGALAARRDAIRRHLSALAITDQRPWGVDPDPDWPEPTEDERRAMQHFVHTEVLPGLLGLRRDADAAHLLDRIDTSQLDDDTRRRLAVALRRTAEQLTLVDDQRDAALRCVGCAHLLEPEDPELTRFAARLGRAVAGTRLPVLPVALLLALLAFVCLFVEPLVSLFTIVVGGVPLAVIAIHQARHPLQLPPGVDDAMSRLPAWKDHRTLAWTAVVGGAVLTPMVLVFTAPTAAPAALGAAVIAIVAAARWIPRHIR
jgi:uncharacterized integral membrane protein